MAPSRNLIIGLAAGILLAGPSAEARTMWVGPTGNDANAGTQTSPYKTIAKANAVMVPGDIARILPGTYTSLPNPTAAATGGLRFTFLGTSANGDPLVDSLSRATIILPGGYVSKPYVTLRGVRVSGNFGCSESGDRDSITDVIVDGNFDHQGGDYSIYSRCKFKGGKFNLNKGTLGSSDGVQIYRCDFPYVGQGVTSGDHNWLVWGADSTVEMFNRRLITIEAGLPNEFGGEWHFDDRNRVSRGNYTKINLNRTCYAVWRWRSDTSTDIGSFGNKFMSDTILVTGTSPSPSTMLPTSSANCGAGTYLPQCVGAWNATMDSCFINATGVNGVVDIVWEGGMTGWTIKNTVIATNGGAVRAFDVHGSSVKNCTIAGMPAAVWTDSYSRALWQAGDMKFDHNIVVAWSGSPIQFDATMLIAGAYVVGNNLYWGGGIVPTWPVDTSSRYGDPLFVNGNKGVAFDPHVRTGSLALTLGAGAYQGAATGPDTTPPATIADLRNP